MSTTKIASYKVYDGSNWIVMSFNTIGSAVQLSNPFNDNAATDLQTFADNVHDKFAELSCRDITSPEGNKTLETYLNTLQAVTNDAHTLAGNAFYGVNVTTEGKLRFTRPNGDAPVEITIPTSADLKDYVDDEIAKLVNGAPEAMNTFKELADIVGSDTTGTGTILGKLKSHDDSIGDLTHQWDTLSNSYQDLYERLQSELKNEAFIVSWANKATYDKNGNDIATTYITSVGVDNKIGGQCLNYKNIFLGAAKSNDTNMPDKAQAGYTLKSGDIWIQYS